MAPRPPVCISKFQAGFESCKNTGPALVSATCRPTLRKDPGIPRPPGNPLHLYPSLLFIRATRCVSTFIPTLPTCVLRSRKPGTVVSFPPRLLSHLTATNTESERSKYLQLSGCLFEFPERTELRKLLMCFLEQLDGFNIFREQIGDCC